MAYGWKFPIGVDIKTGRIQTCDLQTDIRESIRILIETRKGERIGRPDYGSQVDRYMFQTIGPSLMAEIRQDLQRLLRFWEKRIESPDIEIRPASEDACLLIDIRYRIKELDQTDELLIELPLNQDRGQ